MPGMRVSFGRYARASDLSAQDARLPDSLPDLGLLGEREMDKFRKKPVVIEAELFTEELALKCLLGEAVFPFGLTVSGSCLGRQLKDAYILIKTLEGTMEARPGDWIIKGVRGECYPCKPDIFDATYESVSGDETVAELAKEPKP